MYCNNCGKHNPEDSKFCQNCGSAIVRVTDVHKFDNNAQNEAHHSETDNNKTTKSDGKVQAGLTGWLALVGLGLIVNPFIQGYSAMTYLPLFQKTYDIVGYLPLLQFEFVMEIANCLFSIYLLYLYFKKKSNFPKFYIIFLIVTAMYTTIDHILFASLTAPTPEQQKILSDTLSQHSGDVVRAIIVGLIWVWYMKKSKRVKATFVNK